MAAVATALNLWRSVPRLKITELSAEVDEEGLRIGAVVVNSGQRKAIDCAASYLIYDKNDRIQDGDETEWYSITSLASEYKYCCPVMTEGSRRIVGARIRSDMGMMVTGDPSRHPTFPTGWPVQSYLLILIISHSNARRTFDYCKVHLERYIPEDMSPGEVARYLTIQYRKPWQLRILRRPTVRRYFSELRRFNRKPGQLPMRGR